VNKTDLSDYVTSKSDLKKLIYKLPPDNYIITNYSDN